MQSVMPFLRLFGSVCWSFLNLLTTVRAILTIIHNCFAAMRTLVSESPYKAIVISRHIRMQSIFCAVFRCGRKDW